MATTNREYDDGPIIDELKQRGLNPGPFEIAQVDIEYSAAEVNATETAEVTVMLVLTLGAKDADRLLDLGLNGR
ncbi:hypothetical protein [Herbiconiux sp. L3-i23]|uniref:hypothetical protein n=1 Tax=Herbiconiux sp. L3-i23 TaxID=2905871 RepID=UPI002048021C|nr:hypothetical protein [Herbiconiux sp. L3-i23]BDI23534.1 hypothetical protein L3i23_23100 [Herbiconiux sp. L3-i23]